MPDADMRATRTETRPPRPGEGTGVSVGTSVRRTLVVIALGLSFAAGNTFIAYLTMGYEFIPVGTGVLFGLVFALALRHLHRAWWLAVLSIVPSLMVLVLGSVDYAPDLTLEYRGIHERVTITADSAAGTTGGRHQYTLVGPGGELAEKMVWTGSSSEYAVGDRIEILRDPEGVVPIKDATRVDSVMMLDWVVWGLGAWIVMALVAGRRGHVRRRKGRQPVLDRFDLD
ncbi:hypothetical protein [Streptomyces sp. NPDC020141]|uniref:hypothetical protein n=1 Tax=Streptomyces sp. NPDC020141 TaxID=3365065 RepID=UPI003789E474